MGAIFLARSMCRAASINRLTDNGRASAEKLAVRAKPRQSQGVGVGLAVDQQQVRLDVTFPIARPIAGKIVIAIACIERLIGRQCDQHRLDRVIKRGAMLPLGFPLVVALESG
ncbi:hypothetical protein XAUC_31650 [Xanthomonas citri pv. aurantifolii str. ICPB 10535]|nr:hypothetical protein XAUC_31650 [Xanthomonas citri pv. aurantifolii str. ICPB 10535]